MKLTYAPRAVLGGPVGDKTGYEEIIAYWLNGYKRSFGSMLRNETAEALDPKRLAEFSDVFLLSLQRIVDAWICSGRNGAMDSPTERHFDVLVAGAPQPKGSQQSLKAIIEEFIARNSRKPVLGKSRVADIDFHPQFDANNLPFSANELAVYWFVHMLDSSTKTRLAKCDDCGIYFCRARNPRRTDGKRPSRKSGTFCPEHLSKAGASRSITSRDQRRDKMISWAAESWPEWTSRKRLPRSKWIATRVNERIGSDWEHVGGRWVTTHQKDIEKEVARTVSGAQR